MSCGKETLKLLLKENCTDIFLKEYFSHMEDILGSDVVVETALENPSISSSIDEYTRIVSNSGVNDLDADVSILKSLVLSNNSDNEYYLQFAKKMIFNNKVDELIDIMKENIHLKRALVGDYLKNAPYTFAKQYEKSKDKDLAIGLLGTLQCYSIEEAAKRTCDFENPKDSKFEKIKKL